MFLTIVTRTCRRPDFLSACIESVLKQSCKDFEQIFIVDKIGRHAEGNLRWANRQLSVNAKRVIGNYVFTLDDDGELVSPDFVARAFDASKSMPDAILTRSLSLNGDGNIIRMPLAHVWRLDWNNGERPIMWAGHGYNSVTKNRLWKKTVKHYADQRSGGDFHFMTHLIKSGARFVKLDGVLSARSKQRGRGKEFETCSHDWFESVARQYDIQQVAPGDWRLRVATNE